jgi:dihydropteroate synthase
LGSLDQARRHADRLIADGADVIDVGGESTRPQGAIPVDVGEEMRRVLPVIAAVAADHPGVPLSIDTVKALVAEAAIAEGASIVNDVSGFRLDAAMPHVCARAGAGVVVMHSRGGIADMATFAHAEYSPDVTGDVIRELQTSLDAGNVAGIQRERIVVDPGIGFSKRGEQSLRLLAELSRLSILGLPILVGVSRKRFIGQLTGVDVPSDRVAGTMGANVAALCNGAVLFRVHDVKPARQSLDVAWAIMRSSST